MSGEQMYLCAPAFSSRACGCWAGISSCWYNTSMGIPPDGQFYKEKIEYVGLGVHFHF